MILIGLVGQPLPGFRDQCIAVAAYGRVRWTRFGTCCRLARGLPLITHVALADARQTARPFVHGYLERTREEAVAATHALRCIVGHRAQRRFAQSTDGADRDAGRLGAVHAEPPAELVPERFNRREFVCRKCFLSGDFVVVRQVPFCCAGLLAGAAAYTKGAVVQNRFTHDSSLTTCNSLSTT